MYVLISSDRMTDDLHSSFAFFFICVCIGYDPNNYSYFGSSSSGPGRARIAYCNASNTLKPQLQFKSYNVSIQREAKVVPPSETPFTVTCPAGCSEGDQVYVNSPFTGQRILVIVPAGISAGATFQVEPPRAPIQGTIGQQIPVDLDGDGRADVHGILTDTDGDGIPDAIAVDVNHDGIIDQFIPYKVPNGNQTNIRVILAAEGVTVILSVCRYEYFVLHLLHL